MKRMFLVFWLGCFSVFPFTGVAAENAEPVFSVVSLKVGQETVRAELAVTEEQRAKGLMFRKRLGKNSGMLFDFGAPARVCMWMKNTLIPLSVAFIDQDGVIVNIAEMAPMTTDSHCSAGWVVYALEMNQGWFAARKIEPGSQIAGIPGVN